MVIKLRFKGDRLGKLHPCALVCPLGSSLFLFLLVDSSESGLTCVTVEFCLWAKGLSLCLGHWVLHVLAPFHPARPGATLSCHALHCFLVWPIAPPFGSIVPPFDWLNLLLLRTVVRGCPLNEPLWYLQTYLLPINSCPEPNTISFLPLPFCLVSRSHLDMAQCLL